MLLNPIARSLGTWQIEFIDPNADPDFFEDEVVEAVHFNSRQYDYKIDDQWLCRLLGIKNFSTMYSVKSNAKSILVVEKGGVHQWLIDDDFHRKQNCILFVPMDPHCILVC